MFFDNKPFDYLDYPQSTETNWISGMINKDEESVPNWEDDVNPQLIFFRKAFYDAVKSNNEVRMRKTMKQYQTALDADIIYALVKYSPDYLKTKIQNE